MEKVVSQTATVARRRLWQGMLAPVVVLTIALGWKYPVLGFLVPLTMLTGMIGGLFRGRWVCGNLCPRGGFFEQWVSRLSPQRTIPPVLQKMSLRWGVFAALMTFMGWRLAANPTDWSHWGLVFWSMCALTTGVGLVGALLFHPRSWCAICPVGTFQNAVGGSRHPLQITAACRSCGKCEQTCPMALPISQHRAAGVLAERDCLKCSECVVACPVNALSWPGTAAAALPPARKGHPPRPAEVTCGLAAPTAAGRTSHGAGQPAGGNTAEPGKKKVKNPNQA